MNSGPLSHLQLTCSELAGDGGAAWVPGLRFYGEFRSKHGWGRCSISCWSLGAQEACESSLLGVEFHLGGRNLGQSGGWVGGLGSLLGGMAFWDGVVNLWLTVKCPL